MAIQATAVQVRHKELAEDERSWASQNFEAFIVRRSPRNLNRFFVAGPSRGPPCVGSCLILFRANCVLSESLRDVLAMSLVVFAEHDRLIHLQSPLAW
jgi:hypothetical protein